MKMQKIITTSLLLSALVAPMAHDSIATMEADNDIYISELGLNRRLRHNGATSNKKQNASGRKPLLFRWPSTKDNQNRTNEKT